MELFDTTTVLAYLAAATALVLIPGRAPHGSWRRRPPAVRRVACAQRSDWRRRRLSMRLPRAWACRRCWRLPRSHSNCSSAPGRPTWFGSGSRLGARGHRGRGTGRCRASRSGDGNAHLVCDARNVYWRSVLTGVLNPKAAVFFLAFLPQFVHPERGMAWLQFLVLGMLLSLIGLSYSLVLSFAIGRYRHRFHGRRSGRAATAGGNE